MTPCTACGAPAHWRLDDLRACDECRAEDFENPWSALVSVEELERDLTAMLARCRSGLTEPIAREIRLRKSRPCAVCAVPLAVGEVGVSFKAGSGRKWFSATTHRGACEPYVRHVSRILEEEAVPF